MKIEKNSDNTKPFGPYLDLNDKTILVTGGTGLVGCHLLYSLVKENKKVRALHRKNSKTNIVRNIDGKKISEEQLHYCQQRGLNPEEAVGLIVNGFCKEVLQQLPMEFAVEAQKLVGISLEGSVG